MTGIRTIVSTLPPDTCPSPSPRQHDGICPVEDRIRDSLASARVGRRFSIIDSSICVAVNDGLAGSIRLADDSF